MSVGSLRANKSWLLAAAGVVLVLAIGNYPLLSGQAAPQWDAADFFGPAFSLLGDATRSGHLLRWDPWIGGGAPEWLEPELGTTSPVTLGFAFLPLSPLCGYVLYWMSVWAFGGIGMLLLARHLGAPAWGGTIAALGFIASGFYTGHAEHMSSIYSVSFLPWIVWRLDAALVDRNWRYAVQAGVAFGLSGLGGYPAFTIMTPGFLLLWTIGRVLFRDPDEARKRCSPAPAAAALIIAGSIGALIFAAPYAGALTDAKGYSDRVGPRSRAEAVSSNLLPAAAISTLASPYLALLNSPPDPIWPQTDISMTSVYAGATGLLLAIFGLRRRSAWRWWLVLIAFLALLCALGSQLPLRGWLYDVVPPTRYFRNPALFRGYSIFVVGVLAALGARELSVSPIASRDRTRLLIISLILAGAASVTFYTVSTYIARRALPELRFAHLHFVLVWGGAAALALLAKSRWLPDSLLLPMLALLACMDAAGALHISRRTLYTPSTLSWWREMNAAHRALPANGSVVWSRDLHAPDFLAAYPNNRNVALKIPVLDSYIAWTNRFHLGILMDPELRDMALGSARLWFSSSVTWRAPDNASFERFKQQVHELGEPILELHSREQMLALASGTVPEPSNKISTEAPQVAASAPASVSDLDYRLDALSFRYNAPEHGFLMVTDRWADGWEATVNGQSRPVLGGDFIFRAIEVDAGENLIQFRYNPPGFWSLLCVNWGTLILIALWQARGWLRP